MTHIELKTENRPTAPGMYLCRRPTESRPEVTQVAERSNLDVPGEKILIAFHGSGIYLLSQLEPTSVWSGPLEFTAGELT